MSMAFHRSAANCESGSTLPPRLRVCCVLPGGRVPSAGPRSARRSWLEVMVPVSRGRGLPDVYLSEPCRSLWPTLPRKSLYSHTARSGSRLPVSRPRVANGGVLGSTSPVSSYRSAMLAPLRNTWKSSPESAPGFASTPSADSATLPALASICSG